jgi:hypothetical protein
VAIGVVAPSEPVGSRYFKRKKKNKPGYGIMFAFYVFFLCMSYKAPLYCSIVGTKLGISFTEANLAMQVICYGYISHFIKDVLMSLSK